MKLTKILYSIIIVILFFCTSCRKPNDPEKPHDNTQYRYILFHSDEATYVNAINGVADTFQRNDTKDIRVGCGITFNSMNYSDPDVVGDALSNALSLAEAKSVPLFICFDVEQWIGGHPELWNWWKTGTTGFNAGNANNVEWYGWGNSKAIKISWRNWGGQTRVLPAPNLLSPAYRALAHDQFNRYIPVIVNWYNALPEEKKYLFAGLKVGWESSIGTTNAVYHPNGNYYLETWPNTSAHDPAWSYNGLPPAYGFQQIGYAALTTGGIKTSGAIREADLAEVIHRHLDDLTKLADTLGVPRAKMFTHVQPGWSTGDLEYLASYTESSCPGFSCYGFTDIRKQLPDRVGAAVSRAMTDGAPSWGMVETGASNDYDFMYDLLYLGFLADPSCKLVNFYNWNDAVNKPNAIKAVNDILEEQAGL